MFISLHNHSDYSIFDGYQTVHEMVGQAKKLGQHSLAITEHGTLSSIPAFVKECKKQGIKPIIGNEFYFCNNSEDKENYHLIVLAKNQEGYYNLKVLDKYAYEHRYKKPRIDFDILSKHSEGLVVTSACLASILRKDIGKAEVFRDIFGKNFYLEIQTNTMEEQVAYNKMLVAYAKQHDMPLIVTNDSHYSTKEDYLYHKQWIRVRAGDNNYYPTNDYYIHSEQEVRDKLSYLPSEVVEQAIANTEYIANQCNVDIVVKGNNYPEFKVDNQEDEIKRLSNQGWKEKIVPKHMSKPIRDKYIDRCHKELEVLRKCNYFNYLLITHDILNWCKDNNILTGLGRGSVCGSLLCYLMGITKIDPMEYDLLFERFVNVERVSSADIDDDVEDVYRQKVIDYISEKYGEVYNVRTFNFLGVSSAIQRACQSLSISPSQTIKYSKDALDFNNLPSEVKRVAEHFYGRLSGFGCHASAIMIFPRNALEFCPIEVQKSGKEYFHVASYDYHDLENFGLLKLDILGLRNLSVIHRTLDLIGKPLDFIQHIPLDDKAVLNMYAKGDTTGVFQCESEGIRDVARRIKVSCFDDVISLVSLYRPAPIDSGMVDSFIDGKNGDTVESIDPRLDDILGSTYQVIVYQEQVMKIAQKIANFTLGEADVLRKVIGRKELTKDENGKTPVDYAVDKFREGALANHTKPDVVKILAEQITACGRYIFNKSHATAYARTSYTTAWLKHYYTKEYMCSLLNSVIGDIPKTVQYIKECRRLGIEVIFPNLSLCEKEWTIKNGKLLYALIAIKGIGNDIDNIHTSSFDEIVAHNNKRIVQSLIYSGALDYLNIPRKRMNELLLPIQKKIKRINECKEKIFSYQEKIKAETKEKTIARYKRSVENWQQKMIEASNIEVKEESYNEIAREIEVLGFTEKDIPRLKIGELVKVFTKNDKKGNEMAWLTFDTEYGEYKATVFHSDWKKIKPTIVQGNQYKFVLDNGNILKDIKSNRA